MNNMEIKVSVKDIPEVIEQLQQAEEKINNLQSKIDKVNEILKKRKKYINDEELTWVEMPRKDYFEEIEEIENALKEDK